MSGSPCEFREDFRSGHASTLDTRYVDFDYDEVDRDLGLREPGDPIGINDFEATGLRAIAQFLTEGLMEAQSKRADPVRKLGIRTAAGIWVLDPGLWGGMSLAELSRKFGIPQRQTLSLAAASFTRKFGLTNRGQQHGNHCRRQKAKGAE